MWKREATCNLTVIKIVDWNLYFLVSVDVGFSLVNADHVKNIVFFPCCDHIDFVACVGELNESDTEE